MTKFFVAGTMFAIGIASAAAQTTVKYGMEYYVVRDATSNKCTVEINKPTVATAKIVENGTFKTQADAEIGAKTFKICGGT